LACAWVSRHPANGLPFTFVQPSGFMSNALYWARSIKAEGVVRSATSDGRIALIHSNDIADVVVEALIDPQYVGASLPITRPEALNYAEMGAKIGVAIGKPVRFRTLSDEQARAQQLAWKASEPLVEARLSIFRAICEGRLAAVTSNVFPAANRSRSTSGLRRTWRRSADFHSPHELNKSYSCSFVFIRGPIL
jgi:uncharacterized protein YbjT (DUF2867 family)